MCQCTTKKTHVGRHDIGKTGKKRYNIVTVGFFFLYKIFVSTYNSHVISNFTDSACDSCRRNRHSGTATSSFRNENH